MLFKSNILNINDSGMKQTVAKHGMSQVSFGDSHLCSFKSAEERIQAALN